LGPGKLMAESLPVCAVHREGTFEPSTGGSVDVVQSLPNFPFKAHLAPHRRLRGSSFRRHLGDVAQHMISTRRCKLVSGIT